MGAAEGTDGWIMNVWTQRKMKELGEPAWIMVQIQRKRDIVDESVVMCSFSCDYNYDI